MWRELVFVIAVAALLLLASAQKSPEYDMFEPTYEWKQVMDGQVVPAGLEIRMNLQTGYKEARRIRNRSGFISDAEREEIRLLDEREQRESQDTELHQQTLYTEQRQHHQQPSHQGHVHTVELTERDHSNAPAVLESVNSKAVSVQEMD
eukprot:TRINITY_DN14483_c0_g1_i1.p1 TRINITY_DN14483_c0_g1~~TRINITY_DN14483_c0_g1_i1.p1  ORF type:complete len:149 (-),score=31.01 TRINITY_DN14483_c0_g1_i1:98-544(-)